MKTDGKCFKKEAVMNKYLSSVTEDELYDVYGGKSDDIADLVELIGMGFGIIAKLIDKIKSAFKDAQRAPEPAPAQ
jgi:hypothetical protein